MVRAFLIGSFLFAASCFGQVHAAGHVGGGGGGRFGYGGHYYGRGGYGYVYAYPAYVGGYGAYYGDYGYGPGSGYVDPSLQQGPPQAAAPPVIINQYFGAPPMMGPPPEQQDDQGIRMYQQQAAPGAYSPAPSAEAPTYLIAYKDHSVYTAIAYWIEGNTLHYVTAGNTHNQADLNLIDIEFTKKLNADRSMPFNVPASQ